MSDSQSGDAALRVRLQALFREELQDNLQVLRSGLPALEGGAAGSVDDEVVDQLFRAAHSLKGAAHSAGITSAIGPCRRLEDLLAGLRAGEREIDDRLRSTFADEVDALAGVERRLMDEAAAAAGADIRSTAAAGPRTRVDVETLDDIIREAGALLSATNQLGVMRERLMSTRDDASRSARARPAVGGTTDGILGRLEEVARDAEAVEREVRRTSNQVSAMAQRLRMQRIDEVAAGLETTVGEVCRSTGKQARLVVEGGEVEVDRDVGDAIREPLLHLVRNAVDHGIEMPARRRELGKPVVGTVRLHASVDAERVRVAVADDGAGVDVDALRRATENPDASDREAAELAFAPGVSTAVTVSDVSGRGVGLDVVRSRAESLGGSVHLYPALGGGGAEVVMHVPTTMASLDVLVVAVGPERFALPTTAVDRVSRVRRDELEQVEGRVIVAGTAQTVVSLGTALGGPPDSSDEPWRALIHLVGEEAALLADRSEAKLECVLRRLPRRLANPAVVGAVVLPSGDVALVANPAVALRSAAHAPPSPSYRRPAPSRILLVEDTFTTRALEHSILAGSGYDAVDAVDGVDAWRLLHDRPFDLVVTDVDMPRMGGIELCRAIRADPTLARLPVVLVTSLATDDDRRRGVEAGANAYLVKSAFDQAALLDTIRRLL